MHTADIIKKLPIFSGIDDLAAEGLSRIASGKAFEKDETIFSEGDDAAAIFILVSGIVDLIKSSPSGKEQFVRRVKPGEMFAEAAVFSGEAYPASAISRTRAEILQIEKKKFTAFVRANPDVALKIVGAMARLLRHLNNLLTQHTLGSVQSRLVEYLVGRAKKAGSNTFELGIEKRELAYKIGTIPETLSRSLKKLAKQGLISVRGSKISLKKGAFSGL